MIKVRVIGGMAIVTGSSWEVECLKGVSGAKLEKPNIHRQGDKLAKLPACHHVHRNPIRKNLEKFIVDKEEGRDNG